MRDTQPSRRQFLASGAVAAAATAVDAQGRQPVVVAEPTQPKPRRSDGPIRVLTATAFETHELAKFKAAAPNIELIVVKTPDEFRKRLPEAEVVFGTLTGADLPAATNVKWVQAGNAGVESLDKEFMTSPIALTNMARIFAPAITDTAMGMLLCLTRGITTYYMPQFAKRQMKPVGTAKSDHHVELAGKTMGIVGMGGIGSTLARRAHLGFDMKVVGTDAKPIPKPDHVAELHD